MGAPQYTTWLESQGANVNIGNTVPQALANDLERIFGYSVVIYNRYDLLKFINEIENASSLIAWNCNDINGFLALAVRSVGCNIDNFILGNYLPGDTLPFYPILTNLFTLIQDGDTSTVWNYHIIAGTNNGQKIFDANLQLLDGSIQVPVHGLNRNI